MKLKLLFSVAFAAAASIADSVLKPVDPVTIWSREEFYRSPKVWNFPGTFKGEVTPIWIEGAPYEGKETKLFAYYGIPEGASETAKVPGIVLVHGGGGTAYPEWVRLWVKRGYAAICIDTCGAMPIQLPGAKWDEWMRNPNGGPRGWGRVEEYNKPIRDQWVYHAVAAEMRAHSFLRSLKCVDSATIGMTGISWGGFLSCILAAADDRFAYCVPVYGCGFNHERNGISWNKPHVMEWAQLWEPSIYLPFAKCPLLWVDGTNDKAFALDRVRRSADLAPVESQFCTRLRMIHGHGTPGEAPAEILAFADHFARGKPDIVRITATTLNGNNLRVKYNANGRKVAHAELLYTKDDKTKVWYDLLWEAMSVPVTAGEISVALPAGTYQATLNLITDDELITSSRLVTLE